MVGEIEKVFKENDNGFIAIAIEWGDWKHDHLFCDHLMKKMGYTKNTEHLTGQDGSDCYSSIHFYSKN